MKFTKQRPTVPGFYWCHGERRSQIAMAHIAERVVWDEAKECNVSHGWYAQLLPGGVSLPLKDLRTYEWYGPLDIPEAE